MRGKRNGMGGNVGDRDNGVGRMLQRFPHGNDLLRWATPVNWAPFATTDYTRLVTVPCPRLAELKGIYGMPGLAEDIVYQNISKVANMSSARFSPGDGNVRTAASLFMGRYGRTCTVYMMMTYFANYLTDYKKALSTFDLGDLLSGYRLFEDKWRVAIGRVMDARPWQAADIANAMSVEDYVRVAIDQYGAEDYINEGSRPYDPDSEDPQARRRPEYGGLLRFGFVTPEEVRRIASEATGMKPPGTVPRGTVSLDGTTPLDDDPSSGDAPF